MRKLVSERINSTSVRCLQTAPSWGIEQMQGFGQVVEIVEPEILLHMVNARRVPGSIVLRLADAVGEAVADEATAIATIFNEKKKKSCRHVVLGFLTPFHIISVFISERAFLVRTNTMNSTKSTSRPETVTSCRHL